MKKERALYIGIIFLLIASFGVFLYVEGYFCAKNLKNTNSYEDIPAIDVDYELTKITLGDRSIEISKDLLDGYIDVAFFKEGEDRQKIADGNSVIFEKVHPSLENPQIVILSNHMGGNCCEPTPFFIDLGAQESFISKPLYEISSMSASLSQESKNIYKFSGPSVFPINILGDYEILTLQYDRDKKTIHYLPIEGKVDLSKIIDVHPSIVFNDEETRKLLLEQMPEKEFSRFRRFFDVASQTTLHNYRYVLGDGLMAHSGGSEEGRYIFDLITNSWLVVILYDGMSKMDCYLSADSDELAESMILKISDIYKLNSQEIGRCAN